jgi:hypothetical protein
VRERSLSYFATVVRETLMPSMARSPWMRGAPESAFSWLRGRTIARGSTVIADRPGFFSGRHHLKERHTPCLRQRRTVSACTLARAPVHRAHMVANRTQKHGSMGEEWGRLPARAKTASGRRSAITSSARCTRSRSVEAIVWNRHSKNVFVTDQPAPGARKNQVISRRTNNCQGQEHDNGLDRPCRIG